MSEEEIDELLEELHDHPLPAIVGHRLSLQAFSHLAGKLAGYPFVKVVVDKSGAEPTVHFINHNVYQFHADYIAVHILGTTTEELDRRLDEFNQLVYQTSERNLLLGTIALHNRGERFFTLETVEVDTMGEDLVRFFFKSVRGYLDRTYPLLFKPANHLQEAIAAKVRPSELPRIFSYELFASADFLPLHPGDTQGRIRAFASEKEYRAAKDTLEWFDIIVMERVPDDIPRCAGLINANHTTPLSHTNVLASGWGIPNCVQIGIMERIAALNGKWVRYCIEPTASEIILEPLAEVPNVGQRPAWVVHRIVLEEPETVNTPIQELTKLRLTDRYRYGTKAAHLGELDHLLEHGSERVLGFYKIKRPPRANLLPYLARYLGVDEKAEADEVRRKALEFLRSAIRVPRGLALPFSVMQEFLESSPRIQQGLGKLKMALELNAREIEPLCLDLMNMIRAHRFSDKLREQIDSEIANALAGVSSFVIRSSSNAEDLENFSAAGIYESINHVTSAESLFQSIKEVWASTLSPRSVRLRAEVGIPLDDVWMGVIIQEEMPAEVGGVMVTTNPLNRADFRNVYVNVSSNSVNSVVQGLELPLQYLYNTVEGGGRTLSLGDSAEDLSEAQKEQLQKLAFVGRLLQSHFSPNYTFSDPVDIEWLMDSEGIIILQLRPYSQ